jgi:hypothetical protein
VACSFFDPLRRRESTRAAVRYEGFIENHAHWAFKTKVKLSLVLPYLKNKAKLVIAGDPEEEYPSQPGQVRFTTPAPAGTTNRDTFAALAYQVKSDERRNISAKIGVRYRNGQIVSFIRPHFRRLYNLDGWDLRFTQEFPYWTDTKWSSTTTVDLERPLVSVLFPRSQRQLVRTTRVLLRTGLLYPSPQRPALSYNLGPASDRRPRVLRGVAATRYRQRYWRLDVLRHYAAGAVPADRGFNPVPGILFGLEVQFGQVRGG